MKNVSQIMSSLQNKPQFSKLLEYRCINKLKSSLLLSIQNYIKKGYIKNNTLFFILKARLNKHDEQNNIQMLKTILNSPMILKSEKLLDCIDIKIDDIVFFVDNNPSKEIVLHTTNAHNDIYKERADGNIEINIQDEKLKQIANNILNIIKNNR
jgi:hypothetical protein